MKYKFLICSFFIQFALCAFPKVERMEEILPYIKDSEQTLIVFDINYTLIMPSDPAFHMAHIKKSSKTIQQWIADLNEQEKYWLSIYLVNHVQSTLIESELPSVLTSLQNKGHKTLALTACPSVELPGIGQTMELRNQDFERLGIHFNQSFPSLAPFRMTEFKDYQGSYPGFYQGILFCNCSRSLKIEDLATKGDVLEHFLKKIEWIPESIIMVDDEPQNLEDMAETMKKLGIPFTGLHYIGAQTQVPPPISQVDMQKRWQEIIQQIKNE
ncbi:MAG: DUF2608 domain-containing protein [Parachlamydia sp.]|jgi:hypothetical protein|nr:DUF2608 domain-containing protein [Parachlamydia sp.]